MEYLDERFPHPPLLPVYPVARAKSRLMISRIIEDWYSLADKIESNTGDVAEYKKQLLESILSINSVFAEQEFFLSDDFTLVDCCIAPLLWRLPKYGIELPVTQAHSILAYKKRIFARNSFQVSLTHKERSYAKEGTVTMKSVEETL